MATALENVIADAAAGATKPGAAASGTNAPPAPPADNAPTGITQAAHDAAIAVATATAQSTTRMLCADIISLACSAGVPTMAAALIKDGATLEHATARINGAKEIAATCERAALICPQLDAKTLAAQYVAAGASVEHVGNEMLKLVAGVQAAAAPTMTVHSGKVEKPVDQAALNASWGEAHAKVGGKKKKAA